MKLAIISNFLIRSFFLFLIFYLWGTFIFDGFFLTFTFAFFMTCIINYAWFFFAIKRRKKKTLTKKELEHADKVMLQLEFLSEQESLILFYTALERYFLLNEHGGNGEEHLPLTKVIIEQDKLSVNNISDSEMKVSNANIFSLFHKEVTKQDIIKCISHTKIGAKTVIFAKSVPTDIKLFFKRLNCAPTFIESEQLYATLLKPTETFPPFTIEVKKSTRMTLRQFRDIALQRRKAKGYILVGILILATSFIVRPTIFYIVMATIVFGLATLSFFKGGHAERDKLW